MIPAELYQTIYLLLVTIFTLTCYIKYHSAYRLQNEIKIYAFIFAVALVLYIGFRPIHAVFSDTVGYANYFEYMSESVFQFSYNVDNLGFDNLLVYMATAGYKISDFFLLIAAIYFIGRYIALRKIFPNNTWTAYLIFLGAFITFASATNGIKAGAAASIFVCAIAYKDKKIFAATLLILSWLTHHSMSVCIAAYILTYFYKNTRVYVTFWCFSLIIAILHITYFQEFFANYVDEQGQGYLLAEGGWLTGMRYDFVLYSIFPILIGWYYVIKKGIDIPEYTFILNLYTLLNGLWLLCMYASFTNRIAALSWMLYHIVIIYPFLSEKCNIPNKNRLCSTVMLLHLGFTLFMHFIYY